MPANEIFWGGVPVCERFGAVITGYSEKPPEPRTSSIEVPGMHGAIDTSETVAGTMLYDNRTVKLSIAIGAESDAAAMRAVTRLRGAMHGVRSDFQLSWDPGYVYTGRAEVGEADISLGGATLSISIDAEPWKRRPGAMYELEGALGRSYAIECGTRPTVPVVDAKQRTVIDYMGRTFEFWPGKDRDPGLVLRDGDNVLTVDTTPDYGTTVWGDCGTEAWGGYSDLRWCYIARAGGPALTSKTWDEMGAESPWSELGADTWRDRMYKADGGALSATVTVMVDWSDL